MKKKVISLFMVIALSMTAGAQTQVKEHRRSITLDEAIVIARTQSVDAAVALNELKTLIGNTAHSAPTFCRK